ncbi:serine/threonine-protein kinase-like protein ACR4 [Phragmites australis]|uniref:serine/threonine-protein kinase-like protein ACR4 n=1 Tax=Phragmites australis TaxID=29695 RepID=UPI002D76EED4|nr:serine/threonine-protein kinase-like protein ACR4 [Phragmites australis]XP_062230357.1 serine/threonine-protein kinase-like protein ACR4 [Phragmites australis]XP_062230361.1 serine/threonine-protein kinase-like protein ACR4 [Phragmites australis]
MSGLLAAALGGAAGGLALVGIVIVVIVLCLQHRRRTSDSSESSSSGPALPESQGARCLTLEELNSATRNFSSVILIGHGMFGEVYKGLLQDGTMVAVKRRHSPPSQELIQEVNYLSSLRHRNLVNLLGYCQENGMQMLVYEYVPNGSVSTYLHGNSSAPGVRLEFKQRLSIAHGTAKGLSHLHSLTPPAIHMNFKTANVLVDEDFVPKVADTGIPGLLDRLGGTGPSSRISNDPFLDPRLKESTNFSIQSDVYSFGVFLVELVSGRRAVSDQSIIQWVQNFQESSDISAFADDRMTSGFTSESMKELLRLTSWCVNPLSEQRPSMSLVEAEIHRIREQEIRLTTVMTESTPTVTLGSQLFTTSR